MCIKFLWACFFFLSWISIYHVIFSSLLNYCNYQVNSLKKYIKYVHLVESFKKKISKISLYKQQKTVFLFFIILCEEFHITNITTTIP
jgi:hypothetical protein